MLLEVDRVSREVTKRQEVDSQYRRKGMEMECANMFIVSIKPKKMCEKCEKLRYTRCPECVRMLSVRPKKRAKMRKQQYVRCAECAKMYGVSIKPQFRMMFPWWMTKKENLSIWKH